MRAGPHAQGRSRIRSRREGAGGDPAQVSRDAGRARHRHPLDRSVPGGIFSDRVAIARGEAPQPALEKSRLCAAPPIGRRGLRPGSTGPDLSSTALARPPRAHPISNPASTARPRIRTGPPARRSCAGPPRGPRSPEAGGAHRSWRSRAPIPCAAAASAVAESGIRPPFSHITRLFNASPARTTGIHG